MRYQFLRFPGGKPKAVTFSYDDGSRIYNPTLKTIWMERDEKLYSIQPDEEVKFEE